LLCADEQTFGRFKFFIFILHYSQNNMPLDAALQVRRRMQMDGFIDGKPAGQYCFRFTAQRAHCLIPFCFNQPNSSASNAIPPPTPCPRAGKYSGKWAHVMRVIWREEGVRGM